jgi:hypothetical protein
VPAAAVIPAPIAYIKVVAVKKLVVEPAGCPGGPWILVIRVVLLDPAASFCVRHASCLTGGVCSAHGVCRG